MNFNFQLHLSLIKFNKLTLLFALILSINLTLTVKDIKAQLDPSFGVNGVTKTLPYGGPAKENGISSKAATMLFRC